MARSIEPGKNNLMFKLPAFFAQHTEPELVAAVDLGSNSFHMIVARAVNGQLFMLDRLKEMVRLGGGLDENNYLSEHSQQRALTCLARFSQRLQEIPPESIRIVGTNVLRTAVNAQTFLSKAEQTLKHPIEIISGREEARLIYLGVAHSFPQDKTQRLVIDIGGGSTEFVIGEGFEPLQRESLNMGCVSMSKLYFPDGVIKTKAMRRAEIAALLELQPIEYQFQQTGWNIAIGTAGTLRALNRVIREMGWGNSITPQTLARVQEHLLEVGHIDKIKLKGLSAERTPVFPGGVAVVKGIFEGLGLQKMTVSEGGLREGLVYDLLGRFMHEDVREHTIQTLIHRYSVDITQAERVENTALYLLSQSARTWHLDKEENVHMLSWAARLHEVGLSIAHEHYHKHGEYLLTHSDLAGFSRQEQLLLASLVRIHRRKCPEEICQRCHQIEPIILLRLGVLLRLAVLLHRSRSATALPEIVLQTTDNALTLQFPPQWLEEHPLTRADLEQECHYLQEIKIKLSFI